MAPLARSGNLDMIIYDLSCDNDHRFEGWFRSPEDFDTQQQRLLVSCPQCDSHAVRRVPSAVAIGSHREEPPALPGNGGGTTLLAPGSQVMAIYRQLVHAIRESSEDVGPGFAEEARRIHYHEAPERTIRGQATADECEALREEGINVLHLPLVSEDDLN